MTTLLEMNPAVLPVFLFCVAASFMFSGMEAGVFALSRLRIRQQMRAGRASARVLHNLLDNPENFLWTILIGNTVANFLILGLLFAWLHAQLATRPGWFVAALISAVFFFYTFCDLLPKMLFRVFPNRLCLLLAQPFRLIHLILRPLVSAVEWVSGLILQWTGGKMFTGHLFGNREELKFLMQESARGFSTEERAMITRVLDLQSLTVRQVARPMASAVSINTGTPMDEVLALCGEKQLTRLPVWEDKEGQRRISGVLSLDTLIYQTDFDPAKRAGDYMKPALYLDEDLRLELALQRMQRGGQRLAIVLGRDRRETGIVSLEDILRVVFGEVSL
jgi:CBS domain containing-hemolysin-like protein